MAEASVGSGQSNNKRFFCYICNDEIPHVREDFTCSVCGGGFIEEVQDQGGNNSGGAPNMAQNQNPMGASFGPADLFGLGGGGGPVDVMQLLRGLSEPDGGGPTRNSRSGGGGSRPTVRFTQGGAQPPSFRRARSEGGGGNAHSPSNSQFPNFSFVIDARSPSGGGGQANADNPMGNMLSTFLNDLIAGLGGGAMVGGVGGAPVLSNLGDYVWGRDGFDAIVTQLMNQMEGTGPAPLTADKIDNLPDVKIIQDHVDRKLQCSVCWDDFTLGEQVKQLECEHLYHPDCIIPWLKLHGTCPICRKDLTGQEEEDPNASPSVRFEPATVPTDNSNSASPSGPTSPSDHRSNGSSTDSSTNSSSDMNNQRQSVFGSGGILGFVDHLFPGTRIPNDVPIDLDPPNHGGSNRTHRGSDREESQRRRDGGSGRGNNGHLDMDMDEFD